MSKRAEEFMDNWLNANINKRHLKTAEKSVPILAKRCAIDAKKAGVSIDELEEVVIDIEKAINDELTLAAPQGNAA
jgi:hypothetical protein